MYHTWYFIKNWLSYNTSQVIQMHVGSRELITVKRRYNKRESTAGVANI